MFSGKNCHRRKTIYLLKNETSVFGSRYAVPFTGKRWLSCPFILYISVETEIGISDSDDLELVLILVKKGWCHDKGRIY